MSVISAYFLKICKIFGKSGKYAKILDKAQSAQSFRKSAKFLIMIKHKFLFFIFILKMLFYVVGINYAPTILSGFDLSVT
jgi:hypothetical protein